VEKQSRENESELKSDIVVKLELDGSESQNAEAEEHLNGENENCFPENIELVRFCHVVLLLVLLYEGEVGETINASLNG
jgi:hypothetical protein